MSTYRTNGYLISVVARAAENIHHGEHADATSYFSAFRAFEEKSFSDIQEAVDQGLAMREAAKGSALDPPSLYTKHGGQHICSLIRTLDKLALTIGEGPRPLSVLEAYLLLSAAHFHDAPNMDGREDHPARCYTFIAKYQQLIAGGTPVMQWIYDIASAHGGHDPVHGKDTFRKLGSDNWEIPRLPLLAALLRLGDELSEGPNRVPETLAERIAHSYQSQLAHAYARSFTNFEFRKETLYITYSVYADHQKLEGMINGKAKRFIDFLEDKLNVIDQEARYCSQYGRPVFSVSEVRIKINTYAGDAPSPVKDTHEFTLPLFHGYPSVNQPLCQRSPELKSTNKECLYDVLTPHQPAPAPES